MILSDEISNNYHGVIIMFLFGVAIIVGFLAILTTNVDYALGCLLVILLSPFVAGYFYCLKCPCRFGNCGHIFPGKLSGG
jgi:hypothetical protein